MSASEALSINVSAISSVISSISQSFDISASAMELTDSKPLEIKISEVEVSISNYFSRVFEA